MPEIKAKKIKAIDMRDRSLVYYGPHPCEQCEKNGVIDTMIIKASYPAPADMQFDFDHDSHYPNHIWVKHVCKK